MSNEFQQQLNDHADIREFLLQLVGNFSINTPMDMIISSSILVKLTDVPNQLTINASVHPIFSISHSLFIFSLSSVWHRIDVID